MVAYNFKERFIDPIQVGLGRTLRSDIRPKRQTIRAIGKRRHARAGETLQLYYAMRTKQCFKIGDSRCTSVERIIIYPDTMIILRVGVIQTARQIQNFARQDGFENVADMQQFWLEEHGPSKFEGALIQWEPL